MLDFEEELKKFRPSPEIDQVEDNVYINNLADVTDLIDEMLKELRIVDRKGGYMKCFNCGAVLKIPDYCSHCAVQM